MGSYVGEKGEGEKKGRGSIKWEEIETYSLKTGDVSFCPVSFWSCIILSKSQVYITIVLVLNPAGSYCC